MSKIKCIAGITTYNPKLDRLKQNIESIVNQVDEVILVDNNSTNINMIKELTGKISSQVKVIENNRNLGIAYAMNIIGEYAFENGYSWFLTLDQDSISPNNLISTYFHYLNSEVAIISPYINFNKSFTSQLFNKSSEQSKEKGDNNVEEVLYAISSGQLIRTDVWKEVNGFWEYLFIDYVDQEFCFHITKVGYKILKIKSVELSHEPGIPIKVCGISTAKQSAMREYYWARNSRLVFWLYRDAFLKSIRRYPFILSIKRIANVLLVREDVVNKIKAICYGIFDAYKWKMSFNSKERKPEQVECSRRY